MLRWRTVVGAAVVVGLVGMACVSVAVAQAACTRTYRGDLVLEGNERLVITEGVLCVGGDIILRDNARLEIEDSIVRLTGGVDSLFGIWVNVSLQDNAQLLMRRVAITAAQAAVSSGPWISARGGSAVVLESVVPDGDSGIWLTVEDSSRADVLQSRLRQLYVEDRSRVKLTASSVGEVYLVFATRSTGFAEDLRHGHYDHWDVHSVSNSSFQFSILDSYVGGWSLRYRDDADVHIRNAELISVILDIGVAPSRFVQLQPGYHETWALLPRTDEPSQATLTLEQTAVTYWAVTVRAQLDSFRLVDAQLTVLSFAQASGRCVLERTAVDALQLYDSNVTIDCEGLTVLHGLELHRTRLSIRGGIDFDDLYAGAVLRESTVGREYEVQVRNNDGDPVRGVRIGLEDPNGRVSHRTTDQEGVVRFTIWFYNRNYDHTWHLIVPQGDTTARMPITLLTSTPVQVSSW